MKMDDIPDIQSPVTSVYLHSFLDVDGETIQFVSKANKNTREEKLKQLGHMYAVSPQYFPTKEELDFLLNVEHEVKAIL